MLKTAAHALGPVLAGAVLAGLASVPAQAQPEGPFANLCTAGGKAVLVRVDGFKAPKGQLSVKLYASDRKTFLEKGAYLRKVDVPVRGAGPLEVCVPVPASGRYALAVRHEINGKKSNADGGGFSGNPKVSLLDVALKRKPNLDKVSFAVGDTTRVVPVRLNYLSGGSFRPVA
jgi:uncharacterized protein (DUF2141 family)